MKSAILSFLKEDYDDNCLLALKKFIDKYHLNDNIVFWPDLASAHYAKTPLESLDHLGIDFIPKVQNPPNVPQLRPIEKFWANFKKECIRQGI